MTRILWYTDGSTSGSVSATTLAFGAARSRPTTRTGIYDEVANALIAAGWTQHNNATRDDVWVSAGQSGLETVYLRTTLTGGQFLNFYVGLKVDGSNILQGSIGGDGNAFDRWNLGTSDFVADFIMEASLDFWWGNLRVVSGGSLTADAQLNAFMGNLERDSLVNPGILSTNGTATAGTQALIPVSTDPTTSDYLPGDFIQIVSQATGDAALAQTVRIVGVDSTHVQVDSLAATYSSGARLGALPLPVVRFAGSNVDPDSATSWYCPLGSPLIDGATTDIVASPGQLLNAIELAAGNTQTAQDGFGTGTTANRRTRRFTCRALELKNSASGGDVILGRIPGIFAYPGANSYYPNDTGTFNRVTPSQRFLAARFVSGGSKHWMLGRSP